jgi:hypothetical protein
VHVLLRGSVAAGGGDGDKGATPLSPQPSSVDTLLPGALPHVDTPRLFFPDTREGYLGKVGVTGCLLCTHVHDAVMLCAVKSWLFVYG